MNAWYALAPVAQQEAEATQRSILAPEVVLQVGFLPITNTLVSTWTAMLILLVLAFAATRNMKMVPRGLQNFMELIVETWLSLSTQAMGRRGRQLMPLIATAFMFILTANWVGTLPLKNIDLNHVHLFRSANSDLNLTAAMAVMIILVAEVLEMKSLGLGYLKSLLLPNPLRWLEIITRPLSLSFRLFGNMFAGEQLVSTMLATAPFAVFAFLGLEVFVGFIQALIFSMLTLVFLTMATAHERDHGHGDEHAADHHGAAHEPAAAKAH